MTPWLSQIRISADFMEKEISEVEPSEEIKSEVIAICQSISHILDKQGVEADQNDLLEALQPDLDRTDVLIQKLDSLPEKKIAWLLLITHTGDILHALKSR
ncbi:MAG: hypothetical protein AB203_00265 [Parcubacteria bacterium C7867-008]|nr:MAG: hypothetical protein AB203_00265 [Parcubacteria bacterium C7867-008]